ELFHDFGQQALKEAAVHDVYGHGGGNENKAHPVGHIAVVGQIADQEAQQQENHNDRDNRAQRRGGDVLREGDAEVVEEHGGHADAGGHTLVLREAGDKHAHGNQRRAQQEEGQQRAVGGGQI